ncbi:MAG TPA: 50S ribosomal protein L32 [Phycisphaerae bacterium]|nr:50S ribosomal protein L32 [Phycisphaerae bacterium]HNU44587.1 50S ribosomal protein L32 [Phycisphaerae bacterium]
MLPVGKVSKCRKRTRRAHHALRPVNLSPCPHCGKPKLPHAACRVCGYVSAKLMLPTGEQEE